MLCDRFKIDQFDTGISRGDDPRKETRDKELELMRNIYQYGQTAPDLPVQVGHIYSFGCSAELNKLVSVSPVLVCSSVFLNIHLCLYLHQGVMFSPMSVLPKCLFVRGRIT